MFPLDAPTGEVRDEACPALVEAASDVGVVMLVLAESVASGVAVGVVVASLSVTGVASAARDTVVAPYRTGDTSAVPVLSVFRSTVVVGTRFGNVVLFTSGGGRIPNAASRGKAWRSVSSISRRLLFRLSTVGWVKTVVERIEKKAVWRCACFSFQKNE